MIVFLWSPFLYIQKSNQICIRPTHVAVVMKTNILSQNFWHLLQGHAAFRLGIAMFSSYGLISGYFVVTVLTVFVNIKYTYVYIYKYESF